MPNCHTTQRLLEFFLHFPLGIDAKGYDVGRGSVGNANTDILVERVASGMAERDATQNTFLQKVGRHQLRKLRLAEVVAIDQFAMIVGRDACHIVNAPVLEDMYAKELDADSWKQVNELRKTDPKAADELVRTFSYHIDHGYGMDCYAVGPTLGAGVSALMVNDTIIYPWCYKTQEVLDNGPLRFTVKLEFNPLAVKGDTAVVETRLITLDAGSHLNRTAVSYSNLKESLPIVTGIVLHEPDGAVVADAAGGYMTYVDPTTGPDNGKIFMGAAFPAVVKEAKTVLFPIGRPAHQNPL